MDRLSEFLGRIKKSLDQDAELREIVAACIKEKLGFDLRLSDISMKGHTIRIRTTPVKRSEIKLRENEVLALIREKTGLDIRNLSY